jgi:hypothetical protein
VFDASGGVIPAATITIQSDATASTLAVKADADGRYHFAALPVGSYAATASAPRIQVRGRRTPAVRGRPDARAGLLSHVAAANESPAPAGH